MKKLAEITIAETIFQLLLFAFLLFLNYVYVASEFAFVRIRDTRIKEMKANGDPIAKYLDYIVHHLDKSISSAQVGITVATILLGAVSESFFHQLIDTFLLSIFPNIDPITISGIATAIAVVFISASHIILGELVPKSIAIITPEKTARLLAIPMYYFIKFTDYPILRPMVWISYQIMRMWPIRMEPPKETHTQVYSEDEIKQIIKESIVKGELEEFESNLIFRIFMFTDTTAKKVLTPRFKVTAVEQGMTAREILNLAKETGYSRFPVMESDLDNIIGVIHIKDLINQLNGNWSEMIDEPLDINNILRDTITVHEGKPVDDLLKEMQEKKVQLAIIVDEWGSFEGIVTMEDIVEAILGPIDDEFDHKTETIEEKVQAGQNKFVIDAQMLLEDFNKAFADKGISLKAQDSVTLAGYLLEKLESEIPEVGQVILDGDLSFKVVKVTDYRIDEVEVTLHNGQLLKEE